MAIPHAASGDLIDVRPLGETLPKAISTTLIRTEHLEVFRMVLPAGKALAEHKAPCIIIVQCLEGLVEFEAHGRTQLLQKGYMLYLSAAVPHALKAINDSSLLITLLLNRA